MLNRQAKTLTDQQIKAVLRFLETAPRNSIRNRVMFLLSLHGLRAKEVADLQVSMVTDSQNEITDSIALSDKASKGRSGLVITLQD